MTNALTLAALLGSGLVAGVFFAFSTFVMRALDRLPGSDGAVAMNSINVTVLNPWCAVAFFGTAATCVPIAWLAIREVGGQSGILLVAACVVYLVGSIGVTAAFNVPWNDRLAAGEVLWPAYFSRWTIWNHVRTAASLVAAGLFAIALVSGN